MAGGTLAHNHDHLHTRQVPTLAPDRRQLTEDDADYVRLHAGTVRRLEASIAQYARELRATGGDAHRMAEASSRFVRRHTAILRSAYELAHREGVRDYFAATSKTAKLPHVAPDLAAERKQMAFYAPSVARMAAEGLRTYQKTLRGAKAASAPSLRESGETTIRLAAGDGYNPYRDARGRFAPGPHAPRAHRERPGESNIIGTQHEPGHPFYRSTRGAADLRAEHQRLERVARQREAAVARAQRMHEAAQRKRAAEGEEFQKHGGYSGYGRENEMAKGAYEAARAYEAATSRRAGRAQYHANEARYQADRAKALAERAERPVKNPFRPDLKALSRATSTKDVEEWLRKTYPNTEFALKGAHPTAAKRLAQEVADFAAQHPEAMKTLKFMGVHGDPRAAKYEEAHGLDFADKGWSGSYDEQGTRSIIFSKLSVGDPRSTQRVFNRSVHVGWTAAAEHTTDAASYTARHELGHHLDYHLQNYGGNPAARRATLRMSNEVSDQHSGNTLGGYASTLRAEHWAEAFAAMKYGGERRQRDPYVQELYDMLRAFG